MKSLIIELMAATTLIHLWPQFDVRLARKIGDYAGYIPSPIRKMDYDVVDQPGRPLYNGFTTIQIRTNLQDVFDLSIRNRDHRVFDFTNCFVFDYPFLREHAGRNVSKLKKSDRATMEANGCVDIHILRRPGDEAKIRS